MNERIENLLVELALAEWRLREAAQYRERPEPWKRGYIAPDMSAKSAIVANVAIGRMMRCE